MKKQILLASALAGLSAAPAFAGALIFEPAPEPQVEVAPAPMAAPAPIVTWTGPYAGVQVGWGEVDLDVEGGTFDADGAEGIVPDFGVDDDGLVYGAQLGYDAEMGGFVLGGELAYARSEAEPSTTITGTLDGVAADFDASAEIDHIARLTARAGYSLGRTLLYVKGGGVWIDGEAEFAGTSESADDFGWVAGGGVEHLITDNISAGVEYLYHEVDDLDDSGIDVELQTVAARVNFRF